MIRRTLIGITTLLVCGSVGAFWLKSKETVSDVIVVGGGYAGLAAAVSAAKKGLKVVVLEKRARVGLNTHSDRGLFASSKSPSGEPSFGDSVENHFRQSYESGGCLADPAVLRAFVSGAPETLAWLGNLGMSFDKTAINSNSLWRRCYQPLQNGYVETLAREAIRLGVNFVFNEKVIDIQRTSNRMDVVITSTDKGNKKEYKGRYGIILCAGGFGANLGLIKRFSPKYGHLESDNEQGSSGEVLLLAKEKGAALCGLDRILCLPRPPGNFKSQGYLHLNVSRFIFINSRGKRFVSEDALRPAITEAFFREGNNPVYELADDLAVKNYQLDIQKDLWRGIEHGTVFKGKNLTDLASKISIPPYLLADTVERYNSFVEKKKDLDFGKSSLNLLHKIAHGPFWAVRVNMKIHESLGGLVIDERCRVLDETNRPILGLYGAGSIVGNVHGNNRLGGNGLSSSITLGRLAGQEVGRI